MMQKLSVPQASLLREILDKRYSRVTIKPDFRERIEQDYMTASDRQLLTDILTDELVETGFQPDSEPNARGLLIEDLIDIVRSTNQAANKG